MTLKSQRNSGFSFVFLFCCIVVCFPSPSLLTVSYPQTNIAPKASTVSGEEISKEGSVPSEEGISQAHEPVTNIWTQGRDTDMSPFSVLASLWGSGRSTALEKETQPCSTRMMQVWRLKQLTQRLFLKSFGNGTSSNSMLTALCMRPR